MKHIKAHIKKKIIFIIILCISVQTLSAQSSFSEIKKHHSWAWLGLDFSNAKLVGREEFNDPKKRIDHYFILGRHYLKQSKHEDARQMFKLALTKKLPSQSLKNEIDNYLINLE